jgi:O-antigen/teichoic acid export membrane protein
VGIAGLSAIGWFIFCGLTAARTFRVQVPIYFAQMVIVVAGAALFVPLYGLIGAGIALLLSAIAVVLGGLWAMHLVLRRRVQY